VKSEPHYHPIHDHGLLDPLGFALEVVAVGVCVRETFRYFTDGREVRSSVAMWRIAFVAYFSVVFAAGGAWLDATAVALGVFALLALAVLVSQFVGWLFRTE
jgi:hypothetical protein